MAHWKILYLKMKTKYIYNLLLRTLVVGALLFCLGQPKVHAQQVAVKTNGLMWLAMMPNAGCEFVVGERAPSTSQRSAR